MKKIREELKHAWWAASCSFPGLYTLYRSWGIPRWRSFRYAADCAYAAYRIRPEQCPSPTP